MFSAFSGTSEKQHMTQEEKEAGQLVSWQAEKSEKSVFTACVSSYKKPAHTLILVLKLCFKQFRSVATSATLTQVSSQPFLIRRNSTHISGCLGLHL